MRQLLYDGECSLNSTLLIDGLNCMEGGANDSLSSSDDRLNCTEGGTNDFLNSSDD